jgi:hypothetical protein
MPIVDFHKRLERAEKKLNTSAIYDENKKLIRQFVNFKTAEGVTIARQHKYITTLRLIAERYLDGGSFIDLTKEDLVGLVAKIERSKLGAWSKHDYEVILKTF